jgi:hypothetical protein
MESNKLVYDVMIHLEPTKRNKDIPVVSHEQI